MVLNIMWCLFRPAFITTFPVVVTQWLIQSRVYERCHWVEDGLNGSELWCVFAAILTLLHLPQMRKSICWRMTNVEGVKSQREFTWSHVPLVGLFIVISAKNMLKQVSMLLILQYVYFWIVTMQVDCMHALVAKRTWRKLVCLLSNHMMYWSRQHLYNICIHFAGDVMGGGIDDDGSSKPGWAYK